MIQPLETFPRLLKEDCPRPNSFFPLLSIAPADTTDPIINKASDEELGNVLVSRSLLSTASTNEWNQGPH